MLGQNLVTIKNKYPYHNIFENVSYFSIVLAELQGIIFYAEMGTQYLPAH